MEEVEYTHMTSYSEDSAIYSEGSWTVIRKILQSRSNDGINWENREFSIMSIDKNIDAAHKTALSAMLNKIIPVNYNLFALENDPEIIETITKEE